MTQGDPATKGNKKPGRSTRRCSRKLAMQGFYQWRVAGGAVEVIEAQLRDGEEFAKTDQDFFSDLLRGGLAKSAELEQQIQTCLDRPLKELSPVEFAILLLGAYELSDHLETPYRVVINEAVELAKTYGGSDGHKYVNGVLDKLAARMRSPEVNTAN